MARVLITGASGMLGTELVKVIGLRHEVVGLSRRRPAAGRAAWVEADLSKPGSIARAAQSARPELVIHAGAMTNVDECERNPALAMQVNQHSTAELSAYCADAGIRVIYISTDSVFDGTKAGEYEEGDAVNPLNTYGLSKLGGERVVLSGSTGLVLRTNIFGWREAGPTSLAEWILGGLRARSTLTMFKDVMFSPVASVLLAGMVLRCADRPIAGLFHAGGADSISKYEFGVLIAKEYGLDATCLEPISIDDRPLSARRSKNMAMSSRRLERELGIQMPSVAVSIAAWKGLEPATTGRVK